jgi:hypothetical protein
MFMVDISSYWQVQNQHSWGHLVSKPPPRNHEIPRGSTVICQIFSSWNATEKKVADQGCFCPQLVDGDDGIYCNMR